jgi:hypothetical protein
MTNYVYHINNIEMWTQQICHIVVNFFKRIGHNQMGNLREMH